MNQQLHPYQDQIKIIEEQIKESQKMLQDDQLKQLAQDEITKLEKQKKQLLQASKDYQEALKEDDQTGKSVTKSNAIVEIRAGAGGDEAKIWASEIMRMYLRFCDQKKLKYKYIDDLVFKVQGKTAIHFNENQKITLYPFELLRFDSGVHRVQRVPSTESQGRIHTSTASVAVLPEISAKTIKINEEDLEWQFMRSSGAGGQSVNKTNSAVRLTHKPTNITVVARQERKQAQNREIALSLLRSQLWELQEEKRLSKIDKARSAIGRNMRAEKIRTYNFPQNRVTDHRINQSWYDLENILDGDLEEIISTVRSKLKQTEE